MSVNRIPVVDALPHAWFGKLPQDWNIKPVRIALQERYAKNDLGVRDNYLSLISGVGIVPYAEKGDLGNKKPEDLSKCKCVEKGDFVINSMNFVIGGFGRSSFTGICSPVYIVAKPNERQFDPRFLMRVFQVTEFQRHVGRLGNGILELRMAIGWDELKNQPIPAPPLPEQTRIANFLDEQTARIDALIAEKERLDALLGEYRGSLISAAVTGQLDPTMGEAPRRAHERGGGVNTQPSLWKRLKHVAVIKGGAGFPHEEQGLPDEELPLYKVNALDSATNFGTLARPEDTISRVTAKRLGAHVFKPGTVVFAKVGAALLLNRFRQLSSEACLDNNMMGLEPLEGHLLPRYLMYAMGTKDLSLIANPGAVPSVNGSQIAEESIFCPSVSDQTRIANFLDEQTARIDALREHCKKHIILLREYRSSLISAAVTGQLDIDSFEKGVA